MSLIKKIKIILQKCYAESLLKLLIYLGISFFLGLIPSIYLVINKVYSIVVYAIYLLLFIIYFIVMVKYFYKLERELKIRYIISRFIRESIFFILIVYLLNFSNNTVLFNIILIYLWIKLAFIVMVSDSKKFLYSKYIQLMNIVKLKILHIEDSLEIVGWINLIKHIFIILLNVSFVVLIMQHFTIFNFVNNFYNHIVFCMIIMIFLLIILDLIFPLNNNNSIEFKYVQLDFNNIMESNIYYEHQMFKESRRKRVVGIKFKEFLSNYKVSINNHYYTKVLNNNHNVNSEYIYFCIDDKTRHSKKVNFILKSNKKKYKLVMLFEIKQMDNELIISNYKILSIRKVLFLLFKDGINIDVSKQDVLSILRYSYKYNNNILNQELNLKDSYDSAWLFHNGRYGSGKTSLDILSILESNDKPVIISPWENNYDVDFLYLVYQKTKSCCKGKGISINLATWLKSPTNIIFYTTVFSVSMLIYQLFGHFIKHLII